MTDTAFFVPTSEAARVLGVSHQHALALIRDGRLQAINISRGRVPRYRVSLQDLGALSTPAGNLGVTLG